MEKPTIFFSHSSSDRDYILKLKNIIHKRTGRSVEVFQSSDGESIPFGNNWIHKIEENLKKAKIMLVFVSPKSASSAWIYFESGFAYSKGVKVIPIGISGIDVGTIKPPLNLLQGFNISSADGLGNLITVINREFQTEFDEQFSPTEYGELSIFDQSKVQNKISDQFDEISIRLPKTIKIDEETSTDIATDCIDKIEKFFSKEGIQYHRSESSFNGTMPSLTSHGIKITRSSEGSIHIKISIDSISMYEPLINEIPKFYSENLKRGWMHIIPSSEYQLVTSSTKLSSKLHQSGFELSETGHGFYSAYQWNIKTIAKDRQITDETVLINFSAGTFKAETLYKILEKLIEAKVIYQ